MHEAIRFWRQRIAWRHKAKQAGRSSGPDAALMKLPPRYIRWLPFIVAALIVASAVQLNPSLWFWTW